MLKQRARVIAVSYVVMDLVLTACAFWVAHAGRAAFGRIADHLLGPVYPFSQYLPLLALVLPLWFGVFTAVGLYRVHPKARGRDLSRTLQALVIAGLLLAFWIFALRLQFVSRPFLMLFLLLDGLLIVAGRAVVRGFVLGGSPRQIVVAGDWMEVAKTVASLERERDWGLHIIGVASNGKWSTARFRYPVLGTYADLPALVRREVVDEVIVAATPGRVDEVRELEAILPRLEEQGITLRLAVNFLPRSFSQVSVEQFAGMPFLIFSTAPRNEALLFVRRVADLLMSAVVLVVLSPVLLVIAAAVKLTSPGPVLFRQMRCGLNGRPFTFLKFRSMDARAEELKPWLAPYNEMDGPAFKMTNDPRVTPLGRFLRRTSLDELPQLWNILKGEMSFVGPRPAVLEEVEQYEPWQRRRLSMQPGLTCLWQISGRNDLTFQEWMRLDLEYIDNWSLWLDCKIALKTIPAVLLGRGAK